MKKVNIKSRDKNLESKFIKDIVDSAYPLKNDVFMLFARRKDFCQEFLRVLLQDKKLIVVENEIQKNLPTIFSKNAVIDMLCRLGDKRVVNVEIQLAYEKEHAKRILEYVSKIKCYLMEVGTKYKNIKDTIVIYLTKEDIFKKGSTIYEVDMNVISDIGKKIEKWDAGMKVYYVNTEGLTNKRINEYLKILSDSTTYNNKFKVTSRTKKDLFEKGGLLMSTEFRKYIEKESKKSLKMGEERGKIKAFVEMVKKGLIDVKVAIQSLGMTEEEFTTLIK